MARITGIGGVFFKSTMSTTEVRAVSEWEQQAVIDVITLAFSTDPMARWAYPLEALTGL